ncbi:male-specific lethal 1 homolog [Anthonomus grandis grandis]|uniref:male-specific lethal 1 homolog n=1 Tax=Anthonomus grandis grandis TaxID=2921223 RepID=UPI002165FBFA|nr:male-specific lethal 1 homolog [Anthonomus grandis grandis]XP_050302664.1 male-specific lethal 1 homolog [Anthonomus grandis grandis]
MNDGFKHESDTNLIDNLLNKVHCQSQDPPLPQINENRVEIVQNLSKQIEASQASPSDASCQTAESEVKELKEWLILHTDLIQHQNEEILKRERQIYLLQKENEMLKERLLNLEKSIQYSPQEAQKDSELGEPYEEPIEDSLLEDMTQDSCEAYEEDNKEHLIGIVESFVKHGNNTASSPIDVVGFRTGAQNISDGESQLETPPREEFSIENQGNKSDIEEEEEDEDQTEEFVTPELDSEDDSFSETREREKEDSFSEYNFTVDNFCEFDPMKNIKMSIRRKRISSSSVLSNSEPNLISEKRGRGIKKRKRRLGKDIQIITSKEPYYVNIDNEEVVPEPDQDLVISSTTENLEVPRWRVKHYTSCYTMEGTENLDDEVYNKRHMRLEIDERRRKRWDVQRIREQRVIEKLKLRQERIASGSKGESDQDSMTSLWPQSDDVRFLDIAEELPVAAFGHPVPKIVPSNFSLPWLDNSSVLTRRACTKRTVVSGRRKRSRNRRRR